MWPNAPLDSAMFFQCSVSNKYKQKSSKKTDVKSVTLQTLSFFFQVDGQNQWLFKLVTKPSFCKLQVGRGSVHWPYMSIFPCQKSIHWIVSQSQHLDYISNSEEVVDVLLFPGILHGSWPVPRNSINICSMMCTQSINLWRFLEMTFKLFLTSSNPGVETVLIFLQSFLHSLKNAKKKNCLGSLQGYYLSRPHFRKCMQHWGKMY